MWRGGGTRRNARISAFSAILAVALTATPAHAADPSVTVTYDGTITEKYVANVSRPSDYTEELTFTWKESATDDAVTHEPLAPPSFSISGSVHLASEHQKPNAPCTGTFSTRPGPYGNAPAGFISGGLVSIGAVLPENGKYVQSSGVETCSVAPNGGVGIGGLTGPDPEYTAALAPAASFPESQTLYTRTFSIPPDVTRVKAPNGVEESEHVFSLSATLTATTTVQTAHGSTPPGQTPPGGGRHHRGRGRLRLGKTAKRIKEQARRDLPEAIREAWAAHGVMALSALPTSPLLSIADELGQVAGPIASNDATTRVIDDFRIYDDPPRADFETLATPAATGTPALPACRAGSQLAYCLSLRSAYLGLLAADSQAAADDTALERTISRASAAARAHNARALVLQEGRAATLESTYTTALAGKHRAAGAVRALLREARSHWQLSRLQSSAAIRWLEGRLRRAGIKIAAVRRVAGRALTASATEPLASL